MWGDIGANAHLLSSGAKTKELGGYGQYAVALEAQALGLLGELARALRGVVRHRLLAQLVALRLELRKEAVAHDAAKRRAVEAGVIELAVAAMRAYPRDTAVQEEAISALFGACCNEDGLGIPERVTRMMDAGAWPLVERARRATFTPSLLAVMRLQR